ncbi:hypothetical protein [Porphyromonas sp. oral taxon 278]|uniref:hypothetical protein n=1 Tax=Porphyromonas sp. oral taxon 278 TaxID=712437 RepID=UPI0025DB133A|nr:hypothetical protein [Porphyromonas sp. oral taxon 278]
MAKRSTKDVPKAPRATFPERSRSAFTSKTRNKAIASARAGGGGTKDFRKKLGVYDGVKRENKAIKRLQKDRPGLSAGEARRVHRRANARSVRQLRASAF